MYDAEKKVCVPKLEKVTSPAQTVCLNGKEYDNSTQKCECPEDKPDFTGYECIKCVEPTFFNSDFKRCEECRDGYVYNVAEEKCEKCPEEKPLENNGKCEACPEGTQYNEKAAVCIQCGDGSVYNDTLKACVLIAQPKCPAFATYNVAEQKCECPTDKPYTDGIECIACETTQFWNVDTNKC